MTQLPFAPWHRPKWRTEQHGNVQVRSLTVYGSHYIASLLYVGWKILRRQSWKVER